MATTTTGTLHFHSIATGTTAGEAMTTPTAATTAPISAEQQAGAAGTSETSGMKTDAPSAQQIEDLNFYLKRITIGASGDISQIESFGGGSDYGMFLDAVSSVGARHGWSEAEILRTVEMKLKDKAREYYGALLPAERPKSMFEMREFFRRVFGRKLTIPAGKRELERCIRAPGEPLGEFAQRLKVIVNKMFPTSALTTPEKLYHRNLMLVNQFTEGLDRRLANEVLRAGEYYNLEDLLEVAEDCEEVVSRMLPETRHDTIRRMETQHDVERRPDSSTRGFNRRFGNVPRMLPGTRRAEQESQRRFQGNGVGRTYNTRLDRRNTGVRRVDTGTRNDYGFLEKFPYMRNRCTVCGQEGHLARGCQNPRIFFCFHCGKEGQICNLNSQRLRTENPT